VYEVVELRMRKITLLMAALTVAAFAHEPDTRDLSGLDMLALINIGQNEAVEFHKDRPGLGRSDASNLGKKFALMHNLRGHAEEVYWAYFIEAYMALESK
jgi:hypothetical protein